MRLRVWMLIPVVFIGLLAGCSDGQKLKDQLMNALDNEFAGAHHFEGRLYIQEEWFPADGDAHPLTASLFALLSKSKLEWKGAYSSEPLQVQVELTLRPFGAGEAMSLPVILEGGMLYTQLPGVLASDTYIRINTETLSGEQQLHSVAHAANASTAVMKRLIQATDAKWFKQRKEELMLEDGTDGIQIWIDIPVKQAGAILGSWLAELPAIAEELNSRGILSSGQAARLAGAAEAADGGSWQLQLAEPGSLTVVLDDQGRVRRQSLNLVYIGSDGEEKRLEYAHRSDPVHESQIGLTVPEKVVPFEDILRLLSP